MMAILFYFIVAHGVNGAEMVLNPDMVVVLRHVPEEADYLKNGIRCVVQTADGKNTMVTETCEDIKLQIEEIRRSK